MDYSSGHSNAYRDKGKSFYDAVNLFDISSFYDLAKTNSRYSMNHSQLCLIVPFYDIVNIIAPVEYNRIIVVAFA